MNQNIEYKELYYKERNRRLNFGKALLTFCVIMIIAIVMSMLYFSLNQLEYLILLGFFVVPSLIFIIIFGLHKILWS